MRARTGSCTGTARAIVCAARPAAAVTLAAVLAGCAWAPGFWLGRPPPERSAAQREADAVVPVAIDWGLIHELDATARAPVPQVPPARPLPTASAPATRCASRSGTTPT